MNLYKVYWRALGYLANERLAVITICAANVILAAVTIAEPVLFGRVIDAISDGSGVVSVLLMWAGLGAFNIFAFVLVARGADRLAHRRRLTLLTQSFERVISMPLAWHHKNGTSQTLHTLLRAVDALSGLWLEFMRQHLSTAVALVLLVPTAFALDVRLTFVLIGLGVAYTMISRLVMKKTKDGQAAVEQHHHKVFAHVSDSIGNVSVLQSYNRVSHETNSLKAHVDRLLNAQYPVLDWWALASAMQRLSSTLSMIVVLVVGAILVSRGEMKVGEVVAFIGFANLLIGRLDQITAFVNQIFEARVKLTDFYAIEDMDLQTVQPKGMRELANVTGHVRFDDVSFTFPNSGQGVHDVSFDVAAGQTVAIVGPTGSGKTTLINLLQRVHEPNSGRILVDGVDTDSVSVDSLRSSIATVFQDAGMFNRSIEANIRIGREDASYDDVHAAAKAAAAHDFILAKSEGYDTVCGDRGGQLSGGERQRIAIARAVLKNAPILVLDEATSALDVETEARVKDAVDELRRERTTFIIAHRLSTVHDADLVLFMEGGRIIEAGGFDELARQNGRFASLLRAGGLLEEDRPQVKGPIAVDIARKDEAA